MIRADQNFKIDQSMKVEHWNHEFPFEKVQSSKEFFNKFSQGNKHYQKNQDYSQEQYLHDQIQNKAIQSGFRKLKNEQIEKLKDLKFEYQEIRKITTDFAAPRGSKTPSINSSQSQSQIVTSPKYNQKMAGGRQVQILELEKKQLEIMVQNSMKKIEELLHNQMQYKKIIHELKLQKQVKTYGQNDGQTVLKSFKRRQKDNTDKLKSLQLQKQTYASTINTYRDKIKYLQSYLTNSQQEFKKALQQKRNYEELIRLEKDKYMNLQIQFKRQQRQHEIFQKDKNAQINRLLKLKDLKQTNAEKQLKNNLHSLHEELKIKDQRYKLLLQKFQSYQKEKIKQEKQVQLKIVTELMSKSQNNDPHNKFLQETLTHILGRLTNLENKPIQIESPVKSQEDSNFYINYQATIKKYENEIYSLNQQLQEKKKIIINHEIEIHDLALDNENKQRQRKRLEGIEIILTQELQKVKKNEKLLKKQKSSTNNKFNEPKIAVQLVPPISSQQSYSSTLKTLNNSSQMTRIYQDKLSILNNEKQEILRQKNILQQDNYELRSRINRLEFQVQKVKEESGFNIQILKQNFKSDLENRQKFQAILKNQNNTLKIQVNTLKNQLQTMSKIKDTQLNKQRMIIENQSKTYSQYSIQRNLNQGNAKLVELNKIIQTLKVENQTLKLENSNFSQIVHENQRLIELLRKTRIINSQTDRLWQLKQLQYQKVHNLLQYVRNK